MNTRQSIALCIRRCAKYRDARGSWQAEKACARSLGPMHGEVFEIAGVEVADDGTAERAARTAAAARRVGEFINGWKV